MDIIKTESMFTTDKGVAHIIYHCQITDKNFIKENGTLHELKYTYAYKNGVKQGRWILTGTRIPYSTKEKT